DASDDSPLSSLGFNAVLDLGPETCVLSGSETDQILSDEDMSLGALGYHGGSTPGHLPNAGSLLIDAIPPESCDPNVVDDQHGQPRGGGSPCDIGAVEVKPAD
ncbi:MAG TPA: choice-of-anchor Q domain-containing protein, partial [Polyangiales bacterium]|nr:choice-of-anchor Q domain-containing protein [Polyangiales bacterium]